jgi:large subunit ribosomal protein L13
LKTFVAKEHEIERSWYLIDAEGKVLGRLATKIANLLRGKEKPIFTPHVDAGDFVVVINAEKVRLTGKKEEQKVYRRHTGYPGGMKEESLKRLRERHPEQIIRRAVAGMMPKNRLARAMIRKLKIYAGSSHPHEAQRPVEVKL